MYPYYQRDINSGLITQSQVEELMACLWIKFNELRVFTDIITYQNIIVGGTDRFGNDATNELTWQCLKTTATIEGSQPSLTMRWHEGTPPELLNAASEINLTGIGKPALFNDHINIPALEKAGLTREEARDYMIVGCEELSVAGKIFGLVRAGTLNNPKCLLKALEGDPERFSAYSDVLDSYRQELALELKDRFSKTYFRDKRNAENTPHPFVSLLFDDCLKHGLDITNGGVRYNLTSISEAGTITAANSLFVIKKAVFEDRVFSMAQLKAAIDSNFEGNEWIRSYCLNKVPKFGNDLDEVDEFAASIVEMNHNVLKDLNMKNYMGGTYIMGSGGAHTWKDGEHVGATPDGRLAGVSYSVSYGPSNGTDKKGATAMLNSVSKLNFRHQPGGVLTHVLLPYSGNASPSQAVTLSALVLTFFQQGGMGIHFSVVNKEMLLAALEDPQNHLNLMVRVGGFSAPFVLLSDYMQQEILKRTEHEI
jgi:formate C-acetyltransferase